MGAKFPALEPMNNELGSGAMSQVQEERVSAKLKFPEFDGAWKRQALGPFLIQHAERVFSGTELPIYTSSREGLLPQDKYYGGNRVQNDGEYGVVPKGYFVYRHMSDDTTFKFNINNTGSEIAVSKEYPVFGVSGMNVDFLRLLLNESNSFKQFAEMQRKGGTRTRLYFKTLCSWRPALPSLPEQNRIADCLLSIEAEIDLEIEKLRTLKRHRLGLLRELFPREGDETPKMRFGGFHKMGNWKTKRLGELLLERPDYGINAPAVEFDEHLPTFLRITDISDDGEFIAAGKVSVGVDAEEKDYLRDGEIVLARTGASVGKSYVYNTDDGEFVFAGYLIRIKPDPEKLDFRFAAQFLRTPRYWDWVAEVSGRGAQPGINSSQYADLLIPVPPQLDGASSLDEQRRVADCLSAIGRQISLQSEKITFLKKHKKGILQNLFPSVDEVRG